MPSYNLNRLVTQNARQGDKMLKQCVSLICNGTCVVDQELGLIEAKWDQQLLTNMKSLRKLT